MLVTSPPTSALSSELTEEIQFLYARARSLLDWECPSLQEAEDFKDRLFQEREAIMVQLEYLFLNEVDEKFSLIDRTPNYSQAYLNRRRSHKHRVTPEMAAKIRWLHENYPLMSMANVAKRLHTTPTTIFNFHKYHMP